MQFVPQGQPGGGSLKLASYRGGAWYDADVVADGAGHLRPGQRARDRRLEDRRRPRGLRLRADRLAPVQRPEPAGLRVRRRRGRRLPGRRQRRPGHRDAPLDHHRPRRGRGRRCSTRSRATSCSPPSAAAAAWSPSAASAPRRPSSRRRRPARPSTPTWCAARSASSSAARRSSSSSRPGSRSRSARRSTRRKGRVTIVAAGDQQADFYDGIFKIAQTRPRRR